MTSGKIRTLFSDIENTEALFPRTKTSAVSDADGVGLDAIIENMVHVGDVVEDTVAAPVDADTLGGLPAGNYATQSFVTNKIAEAQVSGGGSGNIDLSGFATKDDIAKIDFPVDSVNGKTGVVTLSASDVNAAPAGYGLGTNEPTVIKTLAEINNFKTSGWARCQMSSGNYIEDAAYGTLIVDAGDRHIKQTFVSYYSTWGGFYELVRLWNNETMDWTPWEWINPPMVSDVEYRTTERINGKAVYKKKGSNNEILYKLDGESVWQNYTNLVGARPNTWLPTTQEINAVSTIPTHLANMSIKNWALSLNGSAYAFSDPTTIDMPTEISSGTNYAIIAAKVINAGKWIELRATYVLTGCVAVIIYNNGWGQWEWDNPPMDLNKEYRTTERIDSKVVYKMNYKGKVIYRLDGETSWNDINPLDISSTYDCTTNDHILNTILSVYGGMKDTSSKVISINVKTAGLNLDRGSYHIILNRIDAGYGFVEAKCYNSSGYFTHYSGTLVGGSWSGWKDATRSRAGSDNYGSTLPAIRPAGSIFYKKV